MEINILAIGKIKEKYMEQAIDDYAKRIGKYLKLNIIELKEETTIEKEALNIKKRLNKTSYVFVLDLEGKAFSSVEFAQNIDNLMTSGKSSFTFIIGGSDGLCSSIKQEADILLSMSNMTFTHQMARLFLLEQIYRAIKINNNEVYHK